MDTVYENLLRQIAEGSLDTAKDTGIREAVSLDEQRRKLQRDITILKNRVRKEKQFNRQVELNEKLKKLQSELENLLHMEEVKHG